MLKHNSKNNRLIFALINSMEKSLAPYLDFTLLKPDSTRIQVLELCAKAEEKSYKAVCIPPYYVPLAFHALRDCEVRVCTVVGFPLGYSESDSKIEETRRALEQGADEIDMVVNIAAVKSGDYLRVGDEIISLSRMCHDKGKLLKVIIESGMMSEDEIRLLCELCIAGQADFVKTSTGFNGVGAEIEKVKLIRSLLPEKFQVKASGGIRTEEQAWEMIQAGAGRIGASTAFI